MSDRWTVPLEGEAVDVENGNRIFAEGPIRILEVEVAHEQRVVALQADVLEQSDDHIAVLATAERLLDSVNGAPFLTDTERSPLRVLLGGTVRECGETNHYDRQSASVRLSATHRAKVSMSAVHITADGQSFGKRRGRGTLRRAAPL